jgi:hypothetical protein
LAHWIIVSVFHPEKLFVEIRQPDDIVGLQAYFTYLHMIPHFSLESACLLTCIPIFDSIRA